jgi:hypothetical protein
MMQESGCCSDGDPSYQSHESFPAAVPGRVHCQLFELLLRPRGLATVSRMLVATWSNTNPETA